MNKISMKIFTVWAVAVVWLATSCTSYKTVPYMINSAEADLDSSAVLYEARVMPKDELTITVNCPEDAEAVIPFNLTVTPAVGQGRGTLTSQPTLQTFLVTNDGTINYPILGTLKVGGMTVNQVEDLIASKIEGTYLKTRPVVTVRLSNYKISVLGEVTSPGTYTVPSEKVSIYGALALAKDMTVYGRRDNVKLIREDATGKKTIHELDLNDANIIKSPYFYLQQNDVLYVTPNKTKAKNSDIGSSTSYWVSSISILVSIASLVTNILR
ncbi:polysaccharide biosynthesis/export family protein [Paraprevotella xylaniphila]|uniref:polysaccharide biosynthesis/export family protein n=1 Tax=Paraprevotella xylaniphila TaxID=454155 RepID=UPI003D12A617